MVQRQFRIGGMTCPNCAARITRALRRTDGVREVAVSYRSGLATVTFEEDTVTFDRLRQIIEALNYTVLPPGSLDNAGLSRTVSLLVIILALYVLLQRFGVLNLLVPSRLTDNSMSYGMLFVVGVLTSVHCVAMCGGLHLSQSVGAATLRPSLLYSAGRVLSYTAIGGVLGLAGQVLGVGGMGVSTLVQGFIKIAAGLFMVIMGLNMLQIFPWLRYFSVRPPAFLARWLGKGVSGKGPFWVGILNGFMPCGPLQSMQLVAFASGGFLTGALSMLLFGLGTVPLMLGLGALVAALGRRFTHAVQGVGGVLVAVLGLAMLAQGGTLSGMLPPDRLLFVAVGLSAVGVAACLPFRRGMWRAACITAAVMLAVSVGVFWLSREVARAPGSTQAMLLDGIQIATSTLEPGSYPSITVQAGVPVRWTIQAPAGSINGCNYRMLLSAYDIEHIFTEGENIIEFLPDTPGAVSYSCWMGMIQGSILVTE